jgi:hypothetical protein
MTRAAYLCLLTLSLTARGVAIVDASDEAGPANAQECLRKAFEAARACPYNSDYW